MSEVKDIVAEYQGVMASRERMLLALRAQVWTFLNTKHTLNDTKAIQGYVRDADTKIGEITNLILSDTRLLEFRAEVEQLLKKSRDLSSNYIDKMSKPLEADYADLKRDYDNRRFDVLKEVTSLLAVPGVFLTAVKYGVGDGKISSNEAIEAGLAISGPIFLRRPIITSFKATAKSVAAMPREIKNSFMLYYLKESVKEAVRGGMKMMSLENRASPR